MKSFIDPVVIPKKFPGVRLVIDIETEDELVVLRGLHGLSHLLAHDMRGAAYMTDSIHEAAGDILNMAFYPLDSITNEWFNQ